MSNQFTAGWSDDEINLLQIYVDDRLENSEIAEKLGRTKRAVGIKKNRLGLKNKHEHEKFNNKEWLYQKYVVEGYSTIDIAEITGVHFATIAKWLKKHEIKLRGFHEITVGQRKKMSLNMQQKQMENHPSWKGGKTQTNEGYVYVKVKNHPYANANSSVLEHRLAMEEKLGRYLEPNEVVHHINEITNDNRFENLFVFSTGSDHRHFHARQKKDPDFPMLYKYEYLHKEIN